MNHMTGTVAQAPTLSNLDDLAALDAERRALGITQDQIAAAAKVDQSLVSRVLSRKATSSNVIKTTRRLIAARRRRKSSAA